MSPAIIEAALTRTEGMDPAVGRIRFDPLRSAWLWANLLPGLLLGPRVLTPTLLGWSLVLTFLTLCLGHSVTLHRNVIHRAWSGPRWVRNLGLLLFVLTGMGGPLSWIKVHYTRDYWQNRADCPRWFAYAHSPEQDFWWNLHTRFEPRDLDRYGIPAELLEDRWLRLLERSWPLVVLAFALGVLALGGPDAVVVLVCARVATGLLGHWMVGYFAHACGEQPFVMEGATESGTNLPILGILSFGEGFHNNHHAMPRSARMGVGAWQLDLGWTVLRVGEALGLVHELRSWDRDGDLLKVNARVSAQPVGNSTQNTVPLSSLS